jgi:hypothetical protein
MPAMNGQLVKPNSNIMACPPLPPLRLPPLRLLMSLTSVHQLFPRMG